MYNNSMPGGKKLWCVMPSWKSLPSVSQVVRSLGKAFVAAVHLLICVQIFCVSMDCSPPGFSVQKISQARILEWVAIFFTKGYS